MAAEKKNLTPARPAGFFREGWRELGRKWGRQKLRGQLRRQESERLQALTRLGQRAWQEKVDLSGFPELAAQLTQLETRAGALGATTKALEGERAGLEEKRRAEVARFDGERRGVEEKKRPVDEALRAARQRQSEQERAAQRLESRLATLAKELTAVERQLEQQSAAIQASAGPIEPAAVIHDASTRRQQLQAEQAQATAELPKAQEPLPGLRAEVARLEGESQGYAADINRIENERQAALSALDVELNRVRGQLSATARETGTVEKERGERWTQLGLGLYERKVPHPALADGQKEISTIDQSRAATQAALDASLAETQLMPGGTMVKFAAVLLLVPVLLVGAGVGGYLGWSWWSERQAGEEEEVRVKVNPYLTHPLADHPAYALANQLAEAKSEEEAAKLLLEAFRAIHLGVYTPDGKKILGGAERSDKDFYLYDFQWKTLAHGFASHTVTNWENYSQFLGQDLLHLQDPSIFQLAFTEGVQARYEKARGAPNDPKSFLILLVDGLARRQLKPYTLSELTKRSPRDLYLDPVQSFLLMLDTFVQPPKAAAPPRSRLLPAFPSLIQTVYAAPDCESVHGEEEEGEWGEALGFVLDRLENLEEAVAGTASTEAARQVAEEMGSLYGAAATALDIRKAINDLLLLSSVTVTVQVAPSEMVHLPHEGEPKGGQEGDVVFVAQVTVEVKDPPSGTIPCGPLAGSRVSPGRKPLKDIRVEWDWEDEWTQYYQLTNETVSRMTGRMATITDDAGQTEIWWNAKKTCKGQGKVVGPDLVMQATATNIIGPSLVDAVFGGSNPVGLGIKLGPGIYQFVAPEVRGYVNYSLRWHEKKPKEKQY